MTAKSNIEVSQNNDKEIFTKVILHLEHEKYTLYDKNSLNQIRTLVTTVFCSGRLTKRLM
ncbi:hypothetical protein ECANGB1_2378 [Enterospora canceri]|uniref:Uncharacterized protein n=1 Tax=Enterospora canceri TaxID=1081671 RepID=A0A1Y1S4S2_9MICR|nr:hypothetical protein ECANGB1_2378 [Enterospora canceri]